MRRAIVMATVLASSWDVALAEGPATIAVFDIEDTRTEGALSAKARDGLTEYLTTRLGEDALFAVVPRSNVQKALGREKAASYKACFDQSCQIEVGKSLAAEKTVSTRIAKLGNSCVLTSQLFDLRTEVSEQSATTRGGCDENALLDGVERLVAKLREALGKGKAAEPVAARAEPRTIEERSRALEQARAEGGTPRELVARLGKVAATRGIEIEDLGLMDETKADATFYSGATHSGDLAAVREAVDRLLTSIPRATITLQVCRAKLARAQELIHRQEKGVEAKQVDAWYVEHAKLSADARSGLKPAAYEALAKRIDALKAQIMESMPRDRRR